MHVPDKGVRYFLELLKAKPDKKLPCDGCSNWSGKEDIKNPQSCTSSCQSLIWEQDFGAAAADDTHYVSTVRARMFLWGQRPWKHRCVDRLWTIVLSWGFWLMWRVAGGTIPAVLSGANRGKQGALKLSRGPISRSIYCLAAIPTTGPIVSGVGYVSVYLHVLVVPVLTAGMGTIVFLYLPRDWKSLSLCT